MTSLVRCLGVLSLLCASCLASGDEPTYESAESHITSSLLGDAPLEVHPRGYTVYESPVFAFDGHARKVVVDLQLPKQQPNPYWYGAVQLFIESPSANIYNAYLGQVELTGLPLGTFNTLSFDVPAWIAERLAAGVQDLKLRVAVNVPREATGTYVLDNLRIQTELLLHYTFDRTGAAGKVIDSSGYARHGTLQGPATLTANGRDGSALDLNGAGAYVELPDGVLDGVQNLTIAGWVNLDRVDAWSRIFDIGGTNGFLYITPSTHDGFFRYSSYAGFANEAIATAPALPAGAWKHFAITVSGRDHRVYIDGVEAADALTVSVPPVALGATFQGWLGKSRFADPFLDGRIDDFRIYDRVLSRHEIDALAKPTSDDNHWRFDDVRDGVTRDSSELGEDGTLSGNYATVEGVRDGALELRGAGAHVELPPGVVSACTDLTVSTWVKLNANNPWNRVFDFGKPDFSSFMYLSPAGFGPSGQELRFGLVTPVGIHDVGFPYVMPQHEWTHLAVTLRDDTATLFVNGRAVTRATGVTSNPSDMGQTIGNFFGKSTFADPYFEGALDDLRISCRAYDDHEIAQLAHFPAPATLPNQISLSGAITDVHDPSIIEAGGTYYVFSTGPGVMMRASTDLTSWTFTGQVFAANPAWITERFGQLDSLWAPDISYFGGQYHLYYAASTFGSNRSCIGHATKADLASSEPWTDLGPVICSNATPIYEDWNAIDPNVAVDAAGTPWLSFGSFWSGIKLVKLDASGARADTTLYAIASRPETSLEAPYIIYKAPYYYLFESFDFCCRGSDSTYRQVVGRSTSITGPYLDRTGLDLRLGGGTPVVTGDSRWRGPGHNAVLKHGDAYFNVYHSYDALHDGTPTLRISQLMWQEGWPINAEP